MTIPLAAPSTAPAPPAVLPGSVVQAVVLGTDYHRAEGRIEVLERGRVVRNCRFVHVPRTSSLWVHCSIDRTTYVGDGAHGRIEHADGRWSSAPGATSTRDIPNWLLCPSVAPIWGRPGDDWQVDMARMLRLRGTTITVALHTTSPRQRDGEAEIAWPDGYLRRLAFGDEHYVLRELNWRPTNASAEGHKDQAGRADSLPGWVLMRDELELAHRAGAAPEQGG